MTANIHTIFEYQVLFKQDFCHITDFKWLLTKIEQGQLPCFRLIVQSQQIAIKVEHYITIIHLPSGILLEILPKISKNHTADITRQWVKNMLMDIYSIDKKPLTTLDKKPLTTLINTSGSAIQQPQQTKTITTWFEPFIQLWFQLLPLLNLTRHYNKHHHNSPQAQGKLLIKQQVKHNHHRPHYRYTAQQKFDTNPLWSQFFYTVLIKVKSLDFNVPPFIYQYIDCVNPLQPSQYQSSYQKLQQLANNNPNPQLSQALAIAWLILQMQDISLNIEQTDLPTVIIDINKAFEQWVTVSLDKQTNYNVSAQSQSLWLEHEQSKRFLRPDIVLTDKQDNQKIVVDVKYKLLNKLSNITSNDLYQLAVYQQHFNADKAWLIYPKSNGLLNRQILQASQEFKDIYIVPFDVERGEIDL